MKGAFWIIGIVLLIIMFIGVKMLFTSSDAAAKGKLNAAANAPPEDVYCWGNFDGEKGVAGLNPNQLGDVVMVVAENTPVKKGDVLLQVRDDLAKIKLAEAKLLPLLYKEQANELKYETEARVRETRKEIDRLRKNGSEAQVKEAEELLAAKEKAAAAKLRQIELQDGDLKIAEAEAMLKFFQVIAPEDGIVLRVNVKKGEVLAATAMRHAIEFLPTAPIVVKAEVLQEWGRYIKKDQEVVIEDDIYKGPTWKGVVQSVSKWYAPIRNPVIEPFRMNDVRTLECIIEVKDAVKNADKARIGQRVRAKIHIGQQAAAQK